MLDVQSHGLPLLFDERTVTVPSISSLTPLKQLLRYWYFLFSEEKTEAQEGKGHTGSDPGSTWASLLGCMKVCIHPRYQTGLARAGGGRSTAVCSCKGRGPGGKLRADGMGDDQKALPFDVSR